MNDGKEFVVINVIVLLSWCEKWREVGVGMSVTIGVSLEKNHARGIFGGVNSNGKWFREIWEIEDGVG